MRLREFLGKDAYLEYHDILNPVFWTNEELIPEVKDALIKIAQNFIEFLGVDEHSIEDIVLTGSNCNYNYSELSDLDLHIIANYDPECMDCTGLTSDDCLNSKKTLWNAQHDVDIKGFNVEVYAQPITNKITSNAGVYSLMHSQWVQKPVKAVVDLSNAEIMVKAQPLIDAINNIIDNKVDDMDSIKDVKDQVYRMRLAGLQSGGEFGTQNLAFKVLRNLGYLANLTDYVKHLQDKTLSLE